MDYVFYQVAAINGFDSFGHYLRAGLIVNQCSNYATRADVRLLGELPAAGRDARRRRVRDSAPRATRCSSARRSARGGARPEADPRRRRRTKQAARAARAPRRRARRPRPPPTPAADAGAGARARAAAGPPAADRDAARLPVRRRRDEARAPAIAGNPVLIGAATIARRAGRRVPGLQRQPRPAVRADLRAHGRGPERGEPRRRQRRADRRLARRLRRRHRGAAARRRHDPSRVLDAHARERRSRRCRATRR